jgi:polysaccharide deacetylase family protein (PEP-CTERM system associated)
MITHCFSMDVEGFCESMVESFAVPDEMLFGPNERLEIERNVAETLEFLALHSIRGTFFVLGRVAEALPNVVRAMAQAGHEIASHSFQHRRLYNMSRSEVQEAVSRSRKVLEDVSGLPVHGFRAPDFSINRQTLYVLDLIQEAGYQYDSSLYPIRGHDVYGVPDMPRWIHRLSNGLLEYPLSTGEIAGRRIPALGGGYFRLYPLAATRWILRSYERAGHPAMFYIHPYELGSVCPQLPNLSRSRRFRHYVSRTKTKARFDRLFREFQFGRVADVLRSHGFLGATEATFGS